MKLHKEYNYSIDYILYDLNMLDGWILYSYATSQDVLMRFNGVTLRSSPSALEADRLLLKLKEYRKNKSI